MTTGPSPAPARHCRFESHDSSDTDASAMPIEETTDPRRTHPDSERADRAWALVQSLQHRFVESLEALGSDAEDPGLHPIDWLRDEGRHGGGRRYATELSPLFNRASVNISVVHYQDMPDKSLSSATALSTIIHPDRPQAPSVHSHISFTELRDGTGYWRLMADLNPSLEADAYKERFDAMLRDAAGDYFDDGRAQGERYFYIPALERHRGVSHFYLEGFQIGDFDAELQFATDFGRAVIDEYAGILEDALHSTDAPTEEDQPKQLAYHTVYFFQVLTLDRGTTSGLLVHDQNDVGILASLPARVDAGLLRSWVDRLPAPQDALLENLIAVLPDESPCRVTDAHRAELAGVVRRHYQRHPEAKKFLARGDVIPPTVDNHASRN